jgi:hypothetical protein
MEEYKRYLENYEVSNFGNVRRILFNGERKIVNCSIMNRGYKYFQTNRMNKRTNHLIHHIVAKLFIGERPDNLVIDHIDRNKLNNNIINLKYMTQKENCFNQDRVKSHIPYNTPNRTKVVDNEYRELNKEQIKERRNQRRIEKIFCECGHEIRKARKLEHIKSRKHQNYLLKK